jgi:hypothetical protein
MLWRNGCDGKVLRCGAGNRHQNLLPNPDFVFWRQRASTKKAVPVPYFWGGFYDLFFSNFFFNPRGISVGAFSGVENAKIRGSSPKMPKTWSPLAQG